jgi:[ribosomal protein S18]-alanine N-acetyltransferase
MKFNDLWRRLVTREGGARQLSFESRRVMIANTPYVLRQATIDDAATMVEIERIIYGKAPWNEAAFISDIKRSDRLYVVMQTALGRIVALVGLSLHPRTGDGHITNIAVSPSYQGRGMGTFLMRAMIAVALAHGMKSVSLEVRIENQGAQRLYHRLGFSIYQQKHHYYFPDGGDAYEMKMKLTRMGE